MEKSGLFPVPGKRCRPPSRPAFARQLSQGGATFRICDKPMVYFDKNYIRMLGSIPAALATVSDRDDLTKVIQIKGMQFSIEEETAQAVENGCTLLMVDTGKLDDAVRCSKKVREMGRRQQVEIAFAGGVRLDQIPEITGYDIDALCIGKEIIDAQLLDMKLEVRI